MTTVAILDYGMGNLRSVAKAIEHVAPGHEVFVTSDPARVAAAERVVFPGQGAMPDCMRELDARGLRPAVMQAAASKPFLGICIGQQMLFDHSAEGDVPGLGILRGEVVRFPDAAMQGADGLRLKVPHMGWNEVWQRQPHPMWDGIPDGERFYFVHSYFVAPADDDIVAAQTDYGLRFTSAVARANIFAAQFHPEKSAAAGLRLLANFIRWQP
ncbi:imidazole glycerol phosphate synthase subunit HisH [Thauera mechernichensis]|uniref:Imidazole glycerol phosphate synthase subunit HisH n=1 Tax=Thauera mechernichensis TaxID=82788 RepID=A0ABW3WEM5_9RHOO|nr:MULTISPECIES: imidazole glycerol phosphate synthase subunit HisH [Thauera]MDG3065583.1 imidazole glycerol phosphate synthase subunit HisH [Thauera mechernichensis]HAG73943.1 imidazole glycerol phosphate synthase subunit HisH [Thauera sp.]HNR60043.1 imidazole glycerol phosphate synthase subunit HisH [Thauera sp.]HNS92776.1 imidazole glycerol phosphate synthase subunit HisH [Thauera sp.]HRJ23474.1 imidazole glycerol phosphate synthase subunit HisH [Thauera sp.]